MKLSSLQRWLVLIGGYGTLFTVSFAFFVYWTIPSEQVKEFIIQQVENPLGPGGRRVPSGYRLEIVDVSPSFLFGAELEGVTLGLVERPPEGPPPEVTVDEIELDVSLLSLLTGSLGLDYEVEVGGGSIEGEFETDGENTSLAMEFDEVNLQSIGLVRAKLGIPLGGELSGDIDLNLPVDPKQATGSVRLHIRGLSIGDGKAKLKLPGLSDGLTIERVNAGEMALEIDVVSGKAEIRSFQARGPDLELDGSGSMTLREPLRSTALNLLVKAKFTDAYRNRNERTRAIFSLIDFTPELKRAATPDGALQYRIGGTLGQARPSAAAQASGRAR